MQGKTSAIKVGVDDLRGLFQPRGVVAAPCDAAGQGRAHLCHLQIPCGLQTNTSLVVPGGGWQSTGGTDTFLLSGKLCPEYLVLVGQQEAFVCVPFWRRFMFGRSCFLVSHVVSQRMKHAFVKIKLPLSLQTLMKNFSPQMLTF